MQLNGIGVVDPIDVAKKLKCPGQSLKVLEMFKYAGNRNVDREFVGCGQHAIALEKNILDVDDQHIGWIPYDSKIRHKERQKMHGSPNLWLHL